MQEKPHFTAKSQRKCQFNRVLHSCSYNTQFIKHIAEKKKIRCFALILSFFLNPSIFSFLLNMFNLLGTNGLSHPYHLDESIFIFRGIRSNFSFLFHFSMKFVSANRIAPVETSHFAASNLGLFCLPRSHKKDDRGIWVNKFNILMHL